MTIGGLLETCREVAGSDAEFRWASAEFLAQHEVAPWMQMPVWVPPGDPESRGLMQVSTAKARAAGLRSTSPADTIRATLSWWSEQPDARRASMRAGITAGHERELLAALDAADVGAA